MGFLFCLLCGIGCSHAFQGADGSFLVFWAWPQAVADAVAVEWDVKWTVKSPARLLRCQETVDLQRHGEQGPFMI